MKDVFFLVGLLGFLALPLCFSGCAEDPWRMVRGAYRSLEKGEDELAYGVLMACLEDLEGAVFDDDTRGLNFAYRVGLAECYLRRNESEAAVEVVEPQNVTRDEFLYLVKAFKNDLSFRIHFLSRVHRGHWDDELAYMAARHLGVLAGPSFRHEILEYKYIDASGEMPLPANRWLDESTP